MKKKQMILIGLLILGLTFLTGCKLEETTTNDLDEVLKEESISKLSEKKVGPDTSDYIIFIYSPTCPHCHNVLESSEYEEFTENANIKYYQINTKYVSYDFFDQIDVHSVPTMILIDKITENNYQVKKYVGDSECINLIVQYTNSDTKE